MKKSKNTGPIRIWKLGDHKEKILPDKGAVNRLLKILEDANVDGVNIVWDSMIDVVELGPIKKKKNGMASFKFGVKIKDMDLVLLHKDEYERLKKNVKASTKS